MSRVLQHARRRMLVFGAEAMSRCGALGLLQRSADRFGIVRGASWGFPAIRRRRSPTLQILLYHRVGDGQDAYLPATPEDVFRAQMECLAERFTVLRLADAVEGLWRRDLPDGAVAITFDDGYRDNYERAYPILRDLGLSATVFLATGVVGSRDMLWHDRVFAAFSRTQADSLREFGPDSRTFRLDGEESRARSLSAVLRVLRAMDDAVRTQHVDLLVERLAVEVAPPADPLMLSWDEVREMASGGIDFGSHTVHHPILSRTSPEAAEKEIVESKRAIEQQLGRTVVGFAYPNGSRADFDGATKELLRGAGYRFAATTIVGANDPESADRWELRRTGSWDASKALFDLRMSLERLVS